MEKLPSNTYVLQTLLSVNVGRFFVAQRKEYERLVKSLVKTCTKLQKMRLNSMSNSLTSFTYGFGVTGVTLPYGSNIHS